MMDAFDREAGDQLVRYPALRLRIRRMTTRAARPIASLALTLALALLAVLGGLLMSSEAANADPSCEVPPSGLASVLNDAGAGIVLTWEASSCTPDEYALYRRNMDEDGSRMRLFATVDGATLSYTDTSVEAGGTYRYRIRSNDKGPRSASTELTAPAPKGDTDDTETSGETPRHHGGTNSDPAFGITSATRDMFENSAAETNVGLPVEAIDPDAGDTLTYSLSGTDASSFTFDSSTGQIKTRAGVTYNYEARNSYSVSVGVRDNKDAAGHADTVVDDTIEVTVTVGDVDEPGTLVLSHGVPRVGSVQRARLHEDDADVTDLEWRWHQSSDQQTWTRIQRSNSHHFEPGSSLEGLYLRARARYTDKHGSGKTVVVMTTEPVAAAETAPTITIVELISGLSIPWGIAFAPDGTMLFSERSGVLSSRLTDGTVQGVTAELGDLFVDAEVGLTGIVVDPEFASNRRFYACQSYRLHPPPQNPGHLELRVVAWTINASYTEATRVSDPLVEGIPFGNRNTGCRLRFGPDGYLWVTTGDAGGETNAQDLTSLAGKVLRVDASTGAAAPGNPFAPSLVYSYGHRNPQGLALRPGTRQMWSVEHGPSQDDEINLLVSGANYGWQPAPNTYDEGVMTDLKRFPDAVEARWSSGADTIATSGGIFLEGDDWGIWEGRLAVASLKNKSLRLFEFDADGVLLSEHVVGELKNAYGRLRTPMMGPNGALYVSTSAGGGSDKILLVAPSQPPSFPSDSVTLDVQENSAAPTVVGTVTATDPEGKTLTYALSGTDADSFDVPNPSAGQLQARESFDYETKDSYEVVIKATDNYGLSDSVTVTIDVTNVIELQPLTGPATVDYEENRAVRVAAYSASSEADRELLTWSLSGADAGSFRIDEPGGVLRFDLPVVSPNLFSPLPDYEAPTDTGNDGTYDVTVEVGDGVSSHSLDVEVTITDQDEAGECDAIDLGDRRSVWSGVMSPIALATTPPATGYNANIGGTLSDTQLVFDNETRTIERFEVLNVSADLILAFDQALTDRGNETLRLHLCGKALDISDATTNIDGVISWPGAGPDWSSETNVRAELSIPGSHPPRFASDSVGRDLAENSPGGAAVGDPVTAVDWDDDTLSYTLSGTYAAAFEIDAGTGQITTAPNAKFNFENTTALDVTVTATDPGGDSDTVEVIITVTNVPEPPTGLPTMVGIAQENRALYADLYDIEDPDGIDRNSFSYQWVRVDGNTDIPINGVMTSSKYVVTAADVGFTLKVIISFTDNGGTVERLTSAESDTVVAAMPSECPTPDLGGRTEVWSATLTPANISTTQGTIGYDPRHGTLSDTSFDIAGDETVIEQIYVNEYEDDLILAFDQALPEQGYRTLRLHLCGKSVPLAGGGLASHLFLRWSSLRLDWTAGTTVHLALSAPAANEVTPPTLVSAETSTDGERITLTFSEDVTVHPIVYVVGDLFNARPGDFLRSIMNLTIDGHRDLLFSADISGATITYHVVTPAIRRPQVVKLAYNNIFARSLEGTIGGLIIDRAGNALALFDEITVGNNSTLPGGATTRTGPTLSTDALTIDEGGTVTYTVRLPSQPTGPVGVTLNTIPDVISLQPQTLTFTVDDWDTPQTVTLTARSDTHSFVVSAVAVHTYSDLLPHIGRSSSFLRVVVENQDTPLVVSGGSTEPILYAENGTTDLATYSVTGTTVTWTPYGEDKDAFAIGSTGVLSFLSPPDFEDPSDADGDNVYTVGIVAADGSATGLAFATVVVANVELPEFPSATTTRSVAENTAAVMDIGAPVTATTVGAAVTYTLGGTDAASFDIDAATGQLQAKAALDYETRSSYEVTVTATNSEGSVDIMVTIDVTNIIELQPITGPATVDYEENRAVRVAAYSASSEADRELLTWSLSGADAGSFRIDEPAGVLRFDLAIVAPNLFSPQPDYEAPTDTGRDGTYEVTVEVSDGVSSQSLAVEVTITDQDEAGTLTLSTTRPRQGDPVTATLADPDGVTGTATYEWERSEGRNAWVTIAGANLASYTPVAADTNAFLRITATYDDGFGAGKMVKAATAEVVTAQLLSALTVTTTDSGANPDHALRPAFDAGTLHYAIGCTDGDTMTLTPSAPSGARLAVNGVQVVSGNAIDVPVLEESNVLLTVTGSDGASTTYVMHCVQGPLSEMTATKEPGASGVIEELLLFARSSTLVIVDNNGVPRFHRKDTDKAGGFFRVFTVGPEREYRYAYPTPLPGSGREWVFLDQDLNRIVGGVTTVDPLQHTDGHDFRILENGNYLLIAYEPSTRDLTSLTFDHPAITDPQSQAMSDSAIQIVTPDEQAVFTWNSWENIPIEDCTQHRFPVDYSHINSVQMVGGYIIGGFRGCSTVLGIDPAHPDEHKVVWRVGRTNLSTEEWESRDIGPEPLTIVGDPEGQFCGQHAAEILPSGHLILYDNGVGCVQNPWQGQVLAPHGDYSRAVEYALDLDHGEAVFVRDHSLHGARVHFGYSNGNVEVMDNGDWLVSWGNSLDNSARAPDESVTQVDPDTGTEKFSLVLPSERGSSSVRALRLSPVALAAEPIALAAEFPASTYTSIFNLGSGDAPQVVVAFSRPVVDFDETSASLSVTDATVASVSAHVVAGELANAYLVTLAPDADTDAISFGLVAGRACADGGICAADGTTLSEVLSAPVTFDVSDPVVTVSFSAGDVTIGEGNSATITVTISADPERTVVIPIKATAENGATAQGETGADYSGVPADVIFTAGGDQSQTFSFTATQDDIDDDNERVKLGFGSPLPERVTVTSGTTATKLVNLGDDDAPIVTVEFEAASYTATEGGTAATVKVLISADPERRLEIPITAVGGSSVVNGNNADLTDFSVSPNPVIFTAGSMAAQTVTVTATNDTQDDDDETVELTFGEMPDDRVSPDPDPDPDSHTTATVNLGDNDDPVVTVSFQSDKYTVPESDNSATPSDTENEVTVSVVLDKDPKRTVVIPITKANQGGARSGDYSVDPDPTNVTFNAGGDLTQTFTFTATPDTVDDDNESVLLGFGTMPDARVTAGTTSQSTVSITDDDLPEVTVKFGASSPITVGEGNSATITVTISADPERTVEIPITKTEENSASTADYSGVPDRVIFTASGSQTFTFMATEDRIDDDNERMILGFDTDNLPSRVTAVNPATQTINIDDDDERGVAVTPLTLSVNEGKGDEYTVVLTSQPTANVTVTPRTVSPEVTLSGALTFMPGNWGTPQPVTVSAPDDDDTVNETLTITHTVSGGDYGAVTVSSVAVMLGDNDTASVAISTSGLTIDEGETGTFTVKLNTEPGNDVTVTVTSTLEDVATVSDGSLTFTKATSLTFTTGDWSTEQEVTVRGVEDDGAADNNTTITFGVSNYGSVTSASPVTISVDDDDMRAVTISTSALTVEEEAAAADPPTNTYTVVLATQPEQGEGNVTVGITSDNDDIRVNGRSATATSPYNLTFTGGNWDAPQTVTVTVVNDLDGWNEEATLTHAVRGADYAMVNANSVMVTVTDNDPLGLRISPAERVEVNEGTTYSYTLALLTVPLGDVTVDITSDNDDVSVEPTKPTLTVARWNAPQTVKITVAADPDGEDEPATLSHTVSGYGTYTTGPDFLVQVVDQNRPGVFIEPTTLAITEGFDDAYSVSLRTEPSVAVTVQVAGHAGTDVTVMPESLTFSSSDWNVLQAVTVTAAEDEDADNDTVTLTHTVSGYGTVTTADAVTVTIVDRDEEGITVTDVTPPLEDPNEGDTPATGTYTVVLDTQPSGDVMVAITSNNPDVTVMPASLTFTTSDWNQSQMVTVTAAGDADATDDTATLTHQANGSDYSATAAVMVTVTDLDDPLTTSTSTGAGGGGPSGPSPSGIEFEWNVERDIEQLDSGHEAPTGAWSDGTLLWIAENGDGADDAVYAYDLVTGERVEEREFELDESNRAPRGLWSNGKTAWVADSGQDRLFAYDLESGERDEEREIELAERNGDPRGIWSDGDTIWVDDGLFAYDLATGELIAEYALDSANDDPQGLWSDGVTVWVSDHGAKRLFAYRLPVREEEAESAEVEAAQSGVVALERVRDEEFTELSRAGNNSPRGIWSDGEVMYVVDASDGRVYSYNLPDAIDARLASLTLSGVEFGEFDPGVTDYEGVAADGVTETTVEAEAAQRRATVLIDPPDADEAAEGRQVTLAGTGEITVTVTSADGSRKKTYRVRLGLEEVAEPAPEEAAGPAPECLRGAVAVGFSLVVYAGGSLDELDACAQSRHITAIYALSEGVWVSYILGAPDFVNEAFREVYPDGVPALTPLTVKSEGPPSADPAAGVAVAEPWPECLRGTIATGFSLVISEGGSADDLEACAKDRGVTAVYTLDEGEWGSYILGAPDFVNREFRELFADGLPAVTPLIARSEGPPLAN